MLRRRGISACGGMCPQVAGLAEVAHSVARRMAWDIYGVQRNGEYDLCLATEHVRMISGSTQRPRPLGDGGDVPLTAPKTHRSAYTGLGHRTRQAASQYALSPGLANGSWIYKVRGHRRRSFPVLHSSTFISPSPFLRLNHS